MTPSPELKQAFEKIRCQEGFEKCNGICFSDEVAGRLLSFIAEREALARAEERERWKNKTGIIRKSLKQELKGYMSKPRQERGEPKFSVKQIVDKCFSALNNNQ